MLAVMKAARVNGEPLKLGGLTVDQIVKALTPDFDNEGGTAKIKARIGLQIQSGDSVYSVGSMIGNEEGGVDFIEITAPK